MAKLLKIWQQFSVREKRIIILAVIIGLVFIFANYIFDPIYAKYQNMHNELKSQKLLLKRYEHLISDEDIARDKLMTIRSFDQGIDKVLLKGATSELANAELQGIVKNLATKAEISFTRISPEKNIEHDGFLEIGLKLPFNGTIQDIEKFLYEIEAAPQLFYIKSMYIRTQRRKRWNLRVEMVISAFIRSKTEVDSDEDDIQNSKV